MAGINDVKEKINSIKGKEVDCVINKGRNKLVKTKVVVDQVYPSMFVIKPLMQVDLERLSYSYNDILCGDIKFL